MELSGENHRQYFVPQSFAHGFIVTSENAIVQYKTDTLYHPEADGGIQAHDPELNIPWPVDIAEHQLSGKDLLLPTLNAYLRSL